MRLLVCSTLLLFLAACASAPAAPAMPRPHAFAPTPPSHPRIQLVSGQMDLRPQSRIGKADLEQARALLFRARNDLEPRQWEALDGKLTAAERAFERFSRAAKASGQAAEVVRETEGLAQAGRARTLTEVLPAHLGVLKRAYERFPEIGGRSTPCGSPSLSGPGSSIRRPR
ncbi:hypothetical protein JRI60_07865 [Archangium violaceum]|uniref:DUF5953 family protein n=1 Tax=Archangium violaceum TaxID=83451 RepID=UPI00194EEEB8|nr:DUF5953 family protein [Archangium violaceum]QRO03084.1 hypothetical protein JRI60_07865 [Archangium violaceum]